MGQRTATQLTIVHQLLNQLTPLQIYGTGMLTGGLLGIIIGVIII